MADKAFDSVGNIDVMNERGALFCILQRAQRLEPLEFDLDPCKSRHWIENLLCKLRDFKRIASERKKPAHPSGP